MRRGAWCFETRRSPPALVALETNSRSAAEAQYGRLSPAFWRPPLLRLLGLAILIGTGEERVGERQAEQLRRLKVERERRAVDGFDRKVPGRRAVEDAFYTGGGAAPEFAVADPICRKSAPRNGINAIRGAYRWNECDGERGQAPVRRRVRAGGLVSVARDLEIRHAHAVVVEELVQLELDRVQ